MSKQGNEVSLDILRILSMQIIATKLNNLNPDHFLQMQKLRIATSGMIHTLKYESLAHLRIVYALQLNEVLGWALMNLRNRDCMIFVKESHRKKGIGALIMDTVCKKYKKIYVYPWNGEASIFFLKVQMKTDKDLKVRGDYNLERNMVR